MSFGTKRILALSTIFLLSFVVAAPMARAVPPGPPAKVTPAVPIQCGGSAWTLPVNGAVTSIKNDEDAGPGSWYWALDDCQKSIFIWQSASTPTDYCTLVQYSGDWHTFAGAHAPGNPAGGPTIVEPHDGSGKMTAASVATFTMSGPFNSNGLRTTGHLGGFNLGGTKADIPLGTAGQGDTSPTGFFVLHFGHSYSSFAWQAATYVHTQGNGIGYGNLWVSSPISNNPNMGNIIACP
ncbi:MAG: hypothetical protein JRN06_07575 [Nitrososphaerota archaeon]|nr:hypothetical protein [Nitrososphaerota archaeon]MDG7024358.1 hypothetical protein [Nitrososphaerota archaeon]